MIPLNWSASVAEPGGVELMLSIQHQLQSEFGLAHKKVDIRYTLVTASPTILSSHNRSVQRIFERIYRERGIQCRTATRITKVTRDCIRDEHGNTFHYHALLWTTHAAPASWIEPSGLATSEEGFISVNTFLQSTSHSQVFAAGDVSTSVQHPRPKSGVFAVRAGPPLAENLIRFISDRPLRPFVPQKAFLSLISTGDPYAVLSRGRWATEGRWVWKWKDWIDRKFMSNFQDLPLD